MIKQIELSGELFNIRYYLDDDTGIKGYLIPRSDAALAQHITDLNEVSSVYFLLGRNDETFQDTVYIGETHAQRACDRLKQHVDSKTESYRDYWYKAFILVHPGVWDTDRVKYLEEVFYILADTNKCQICNGGDPSLVKRDIYEQDKEHRIIDIDTIARMVRNVNCEAYNKFLTDRYVKKVQEIKGNKAISKKEQREKLKELDEAYAWVPEVEVPVDVAEAMVNMVFDNIDIETADMTDRERFEYIKKLRFLDIACKRNCEFLTAISERLDTELSKFMPNKMARYIHIMNNQLFALTVRYNTLIDARNVINGETNGESNIRFIPHYMDLIKNGSRYLRNDGTRSERSILYREILGSKKEDGIDGIFANIFEDEENMKFDIVIGNPPYSDATDRGNGGGVKNLYLKFAELADEIASKFSCLIIPSNWMIQYPTGERHDTVDNIRMKTVFIPELHDFADATQVFSNVSIPGGVCYYIMGKIRLKSSKYFIHETVKDFTVLRKVLYNKDFNLIFRDMYITKIVDKIKKVDGTKYKKFNTLCVGAKHHFDDGQKDGLMATNWRGYSIIDHGDCTIKYYVNPKTHKDEFGTPVGFGYVSKDQIAKNVDDYKRHKLLLGQAFSAGSPQVVDIPMYAGDNSCCSNSYVPIFSVSNTKEECLIIAKYIKTKFFRYLVSVLKTDQHLGNRSYALVPMQDFTDKSDIDWDKPIEDIDRQLYKKYNITDEEISYIESKIRAME